MIEAGVWHRDDPKQLVLAVETLGEEPELTAATKLLYLTELTENKSRMVKILMGRAVTIARRELGREKVEQGGKLRPETIEAANLFLEGVGRVAGETENYSKSLEVVRAVKELVQEHPELEPGVVKVASGILVANRETPDVCDELFDWLGPAASVRSVQAYFEAQKDKWMTTFTFEGMLAELGAVMNREEGRWTKSEITAVKDFFRYMEGQWPLFQARGHEVFLKKEVAKLRGGDREVREAVGGLWEKLRELPETKYRQKPTIGKELGETKMASEKIARLVDFMGGLPQEEQDQLWQDYLNSEEARGSMNYILAAMVSEESKGQPYAYGEKEGNVNVDLFTVRLIEAMARHQEDYQFQLGVLLTQVPFESLSPKTRVLLQPLAADLEMKIRPGNKGWYLCGQAEPRLYRAMGKNKVVLVNGVLLVKFNGRLTGLCLENQTTKDGQTLVAGNWYSPVETELQEEIKSAGRGKTARLKAQRGSWALMRTMAEEDERSQEELLASIKKYAEVMPQHWAEGGIDDSFQEEDLGA